MWCECTVLGSAATKFVFAEEVVRFKPQRVTRFSLDVHVFVGMH